MRAETIARRGEPVDGVPFPDPYPRIPGLVSSHLGLVLAYDVRPSPLDLPGPHGIAYHVGDGNSWSERRWIRQPDEWGYGDASLIVLPDQLLCFYVSSRSRSFWDDTDPSVWHIWLSTSTDGISWEHRNLTDSLWDDSMGSLFASSGNGIVLLSGRILQPFVIRRKGERVRYVAMAFSDDQGRSWQLGEPIERCDETKVVELPDGTVLLHSRATPNRLIALSTDGGESFTEPVADMEEPGCNGGLTVDPVAGLVCAVLDPTVATSSATMVDPTGGRGTDSGPDWNARRGLVVRTIAPEKLTTLSQMLQDGTYGPDSSLWNDAVVLDDGPAAYSVAISTPDGIAVAWEHGAYESIRFTLLSPADLHH